LKKQNNARPPTFDLGDVVIDLAPIESRYTATSQTLMRSEKPELSGIGFAQHDGYRVVVVRSVRVWRENKPRALYLYLRRHQTVADYHVETAPTLVRPGAKPRRANVHAQAGEPCQRGAQ
jgi:hypothetical protein